MGPLKGVRIIELQVVLIVPARQGVSPALSGLICWPAAGAPFA